MPDPTTFAQLEALVACHADPDRAEALVWQHWEAGDIGSAQCRQLISASKERRRKLAEERRRLAEEFERTEPAPEGVEAPEETEGTDGW